MAENPIVRAPYNFVPFSNKVLLRYSSAEELPRHDRMDPLLKSGEIHMTMTADTPVFVSNGKKDDPHFFRGPNGKYALPGSTIRGMVRENMQILGFGLIRPGMDIMDHQIFYRFVATGSKTVTKPLKDYYNKCVMGVVQKPAANGRKPYSFPRNISIGYLRKAGMGYEIVPARGPYLRVSRNHPDVRRKGFINTGTYPVAYRAVNGKVTELHFTNKPEKGMYTGTLLCTGKPVNQNCLYLFPAPDRSKLPIRIPKEDEISYREDFENRRTVLHPDSFWMLPKWNQEKPVFFTRYQGHIYFGMSLFLRVGHKYALSEGLPDMHRSLSKRTAVLDYPYALLGFAERKSCFRSRVSFSDFEANGAAAEMEAVQTMLRQPKPSYFPGYASEGKSYSEDGFSLRGYKQYWLKDVGSLPPGDNTLRPLPAGTRFHGVVRFKNLHEDELGLLLWCLRLDEGCFQSVGMGKPYGFGRMKLHIDQLLETEPGSLYSPEGLCGGAGHDRTNYVDPYIERYNVCAAENLSVEENSIRNCSEIQDFFYLRSRVRAADEISYMSLKEYQNRREALPTITDFRQAEPSVEDLMARLAAQQNSKKL